MFKRRGALLHRDLDMALAPAVLGEDPFPHRASRRENGRALDGVEEAKAGIEMALWDIVGKALDTPVYNLLGGKVRDRIPLSYSVPFGEPAAMADFARERVKLGHRTIKVKVGSEDSPRDIAAVKPCDEAIGPTLSSVSTAIWAGRSQTGGPHDPPMEASESGARRATAPSRRPRWHG